MDFDFIEINRVTKNKHGVQVVGSETINVKEIKTFRPWHKAVRDTFVGDATLVILYNSNKTTGDNGESSETDDKEKEKANLTTMVINENYKDFQKRLGAHVMLVH